MGNSMVHVVRLSILLGCFKELRPACAFFMKETKYRASAYLSGKRDLSSV